ncbi:CobQ/CobB/MinD/ParA nucleotide binding domain protein [Leptospira yanagawae serovar Saopaulo str. Sao Paulo = ATCC 700523]|uniref:ParA family protein n=2 Tax=Leptospira yanagawae TaxID=293069 RepID=A0ABY2M190_9LEPT|nr:ParA family protein [Leptospira yanagawae]EOQ87997.1 CobQ/CobB/MinD/ParA nucleotide binding domain protein [Leptospira yanagawae serovar Saopaulo str. Sao Paulo = ATCC 700523]TGL18646.1 ParA family protein [Leptospira yanagawae]
MKVISVSNIKGGSGKSTTAAHLACALARRGKTLVVDMDMQGDLTDFSMPDIDLNVLEEANVMSVLLGMKKITDCIRKTKQFDVLPSTLSLAKLTKYNPDSTSLCLQFKRALEEIRKDYQFVVIDTPGSAKHELTTAIYNSELILVPVTPSKWTIRAVNLLLDEIAQTETVFSQKKKIAFVPSWFGTSKKHRELLERLKAIEEIPTLGEIPKSESIKVKTEKQESLKKDTNAWYAFDRLADETIAIVDPEHSITNLRL